MRVNQNLMALNAHRNFTQVNSALSKSLERLSSGLRINRSADDAAGLAISEKMRAQIRGLTQASRNAQDGISLIQTAEGALNEVHSMLQRMRELANQAANEGLTANDRVEIQKEIDQLKAEIDRVANTTEFNRKLLLNGTAAGVVSSDNDTIKVFLRGIVETNGYTVSISADSVGVPERQRSAILLKTTGSLATQSTKLVSIANFYEAGTNRFILENPQELTIIQGDGQQRTIWISQTDTVSAVIGKINDAIEEMQEYYLGNITNAEWATFVSSVGGVDIAAIGINSAITGRWGEIRLVGDQSLLNALGFQVTQEATETRFEVKVVDDADVSVTAYVTGPEVRSALQANADVQFSPTAGIRVTWSSTNGNFTVSAGTAMTARIQIVNNSLIFHVGANENQRMEAAIGRMDSAALGVDRVLVTDRDSANRALTDIDRAVELVSGQRSQLGAYQNRLERTIANLGVAAENMTAAESRVRDVDMAQEMIQFTRLQVLNQAGIAMLAQANTIPSYVLQLLR